MPNLSAIPAVNGRDSAQYTHDVGQTFIEGALLVHTLGVMSECGVDPASIFGFSFGIATRDPAGAVIVQVQRLQEGNKFWMVFTSDGTAPVAPTIADIGVSYGVTKGTDGIWTVDQSKTAAAARVYVHNFDATSGRVEVSVLAANRQIAP